MITILELIWNIYIRKYKLIDSFEKATEPFRSISFFCLKIFYLFSATNIIEIFFKITGVTIFTTSISFL
jgi:hypothetical protein